MSLPDLDRWRPDTLPALAALTLLALLARLVWLGDRVAHWDEGRVGYDTLRYLATGAWEYRPIVHGPFLPQVDRLVFAALGPDDFTARLVVALVGGLLPLCVWLYRDHLRRIEMIALAAFLAFDPVLLYYSRFMRNDLLVATFAFAGFGFYLRLHATGRHRYLYAGTASWALAFTAKENALLYVAAILGALVLLLDHRLFLARERDRRWTALAWYHLSRAARGLARYKLPIAVAAVEFAVIFVLFYAPRAGSTGGIGLLAALSHPSMLPDVLAAATYNPVPCEPDYPAFCDGALERMADSWLSGRHQDHAYLPFLGNYLKVLGSASGPLALLAVLGFLWDRYGGEAPRDIVSLGFYWGVASVVGYPIAVDIQSAWVVVHAVLPLAIPAATGVALIYGWGRDAHGDDDRVSVALAGVVLLLVAAQIGGTAATTSYLNPQGEDNVLVQYAQPEGEMRPVLDAARRAATESDGLDVLWYGDHFDMVNESSVDRLPTGEGNWYNRLPLPWYFEAYNATVNSTADADAAAEIVSEQRPPVVVTRAEEADEIADRLSGYREYRYEGRQFDLTFVFFVRAEYAPDVPTASARPGPTPE